MPPTVNQLIKLEWQQFKLGYWAGMRQPSFQVVITITTKKLAVSVLQKFDELMQQTLDIPIDRLQQQSNAGNHSVLQKHPLLGRVLQSTIFLLDKMRMPVMSGYAEKPIAGSNNLSWIVALPAISADIEAPKYAFILFCEVINQLYSGEEISVAKLSSTINKIMQKFQKDTPAGVNTLSFLQVAHDMGIPWRHIVNNVYQFGLGSRSRWLDSSISDQTSNISVKLARDKSHCAKVLQDAGLPVAKQQLVDNLEHAKQVAQSFAYPVVVKPANLDGGKGVTAGLTSEARLITAYADASKLSKRVLVEQFIQGNDYRLSIYKNEVLAVFMRTPASVIGDGRSTIKTLVDQINNARLSQTHSQDLTIDQGGCPIPLDDEALEWLNLQGLNLDSIVESGRKVRLRGAANWSQGGTIRDVTHQLHPDNANLAIRASAALRLDIAGVDLIIEDIAQSWKNIGAVICEVNAQPQYVMTSIYQQILQKLLTNSGRIPVVMLIGLPITIESKNKLLMSLNEKNINLSWCTSAHECWQATLNCDCNAVIWQCDNLSDCEVMPFDKVDLIVRMEDHEQFLNLPLDDNNYHEWQINQHTEIQDSLITRLSQWIDSCIHGVKN